MDASFPGVFTSQLTEVLKMSDEHLDSPDLSVDEETLKDLDLTYESEAEGVQGGSSTVMCPTIGNCGGGPRKPPPK